MESAVDDRGAVGVAEDSNWNAKAFVMERGEVLAQATALAVDVVVVERVGNPYTAIVRLAGRRQVDAVVVGGGKQFGYRLMGSPVGRLIPDGRWPVTIIP